MAGYLEHSRRWERHPQPARVDYHREGFERPADSEPPTCAGAASAVTAATTTDVCSEKPPPQSVECCASGRCEVCMPGFDWGRDG